MWLVLGAAVLIRALLHYLPALIPRLAYIQLAVILLLLLLSLFAWVGYDETEAKQIKN